MNIDQATRFSVEFSFESDTFIRYVRRGKGLTMEYNVAFPDERGVLPVTMDFVETAVGSNIFFPNIDTWITRHEILHKNDPKSSNRGVSFLSISAANRVNDPSTFPYVVMEASDSPNAGLCIYVSYHKTEDDIAEYTQIRDLVRSTATNDLMMNRARNENEVAEVHHTLLQLSQQLKDNFGLTAGLRCGLNLLEHKLNLPLSTFNDFVVPRCELSNEKINVLLEGKWVYLRNLVVNPEINNKVGVVEGWNADTGRFRVRLNGEDYVRLIRPGNLALHNPFTTDD